MNISLTFNKRNGAQRGYRAQRTYDYLYDPTFSLSSERDHSRVAIQAQASSDRARRVPEFNSMFSNLPHHPRFTLRLDAADPVPAFIDRRWRGQSEQRREALKTLSGMLPGIQLHKPSMVDVARVDHWRFFRRPLIPFFQQVPPDVVLALPNADPLSVRNGDAARPGSPFQRTVGVQTDYRDSEAQTEPYSPEYTLRPGTAPPELLTLASLKWGHGLPARLEEVEMIERARMKRAWEATLPPLNDLTQLEKRKKMMDEMERKEWAFREQEIEKLQEARLALLKQLLQQREAQQEQSTVKRLDLRFSQQKRQKESRLQKIHRDYVLSLRKLTAQRRNVEGKLERRDIINDHADYASQTYAPLSRRGVFPDRGTERNVVKSRFLNTYQGLLDLEASLPPSVLEPRIKAPKPKESKSFIKRSERREVELLRTYQALKDEKGRVKEKKPLRFLYKTEKPVPRPPTPEVDMPPEGSEERDLAVIYLQKLLRGRSIQKQMLEGREKRMELIQELRTTHSLQREEQELHRAEKLVILDLQRQREQHESRTSQVEGYVSGLLGAELVDMLDFLAKELVRLQDERRIHAFTLLAERDRRLQEAEESGRRQVEERRRREEDEIFRQVVKVHQATVDLYLEDIILGTIEQTADAQAREEIHQMAQELNDITYAMEEKRSTAQSEDIVAELVYSFLIPEVQKITVRERVRQSQRRHLTAARSLIHSADSSSTGSPARAPRPRSPSARASTALLFQIVDQVEEAMTSETPGPSTDHQENKHTD
ncbi:cilia- and flagella-associated protein 91 [Astyanax mexicanus]|uniref:cilia- and flagella-associated protein 91 n=1 Tax=Astyanax mexicanus TaxID=7994 RepID=UPI0020CB1D6E|nr:cilia- and flagella-associated protein 91 [Astyanax mexicanus]